MVCESWTNWNGTLFRPGQEARTQTLWDGRIVSFRALTRYWITSGRVIRASAAPGFCFREAPALSLDEITR
jgi:hypothetical protein